MGGSRPRPTSRRGVTKFGAAGLLALLVVGSGLLPGGGTDQARAASTDELYATYEAALEEFIAESNQELCPLVNEGEVTLNGPNIVCYGQPYDLQDTSREIRHGTPIDDGCTFREPAPTPDRVEVEVVYDPDTCTKIVEIGTPTTAEQFTFGTTEDEATVSSSGEIAASEEDSGLTAAAAQRKWRYAWSWYDEPARWLFNCDVEEGIGQGCVLPPVNTVYNYIDAVPDGHCVLAPATTAWWERELTWLVATGWFIVNESHDTPPAVITCPEDQLVNLTEVHFQNNTFCAAILGLPPPIFGQLLATHTRYEPNAVDIHADGTRHVTQQLSKAGGCHQLLMVGKKAPQGDGQNRRFG